MRPAQIDSVKISLGENHYNEAREPTLSTMHCKKSKEMATVATYHRNNSRKRTTETDIQSWYEVSHCMKESLQKGILLNNRSDWTNVEITGTVVS